MPLAPTRALFSSGIHKITTYSVTFIQSRLPLSINITGHTTVYSYPPYPGSSSTQSLRNPFPAIDRHAARFMLHAPLILLTQDEVDTSTYQRDTHRLCSYFCSRSYPCPHSYARIPNHSYPLSPSHHHRSKPEQTHYPHPHPHPHPLSHPHPHSHPHASLNQPQQQYLQPY